MEFWAGPRHYFCHVQKKSQLAELWSTTTSQHIKYLPNQETLWKKENLLKLNNLPLSKTFKPILQKKELRDMILSSFSYTLKYMIEDNSLNLTTLTNLYDIDIIMLLDVSIEGRWIHRQTCLHSTYFLSDFFR